MPQNALYTSLHFTRNKNFTFSMNEVINDFCYISFVCLMTSPLPLSKSKLLCSPLKGVANFCLFSQKAVICSKLNKLFCIYTIQTEKPFGFYHSWHEFLMNYISFHNILFPLSFWCVQFVTIYTILVSAHFQGNLYQLREFLVNK